MSKFWNEAIEELVKKDISILEKQLKIVDKVRECYEAKLITLKYILVHKNLNLLRDYLKGYVLHENIRKQIKKYGYKRV